VKKILVTGQSGFIGQHLLNTLKLYPNKYQIENFEDSFFNNKSHLENLVRESDVIVHLAGVNRDPSEKFLYKTNISLVDKLINSLKNTNSKAQVIMSSSSQENKDNLYGKSKKIGRLKFADWAKKSKNNFVGMIIPNVFGPFGRPNYNSFISTFCNELVNENVPIIKNDKKISLIYIGELINEILFAIDNEVNNSCLELSPLKAINVSQVLKKLKKFKRNYFLNGCIPNLSDDFDLRLFNTFRSYINYEDFFPKKTFLNKDNRGIFTEIIRFNTMGQVSLSTTKKSVTRGNHFHTRKIERFSVIKGSAIVKMRRIGTKEILKFNLNGNEPSYVDMPVWYTHSIKNIGKEDLYTIFWINEPYDQTNPDTFIEIV
tara:strand:+ start:148 stop:1266 length:1119 start_codon:yes stop_codon:yes gene_type:complete